MITIKCKCGATEMTFQSLSEKDFPNGWLTDCCQGALDNAPKIKASEPQESVSDELAEIQLEAVEESEEALEPQPDKKVQVFVEPKRRGRKGKR